MSEPDPRIVAGGGWIQTVTGRAFPILDPRPEDIDIRDIAHALSMLCRFGGHTREFYSVAQHSVLVSLVLERFQPDNHVLKLGGLLHDRGEGYLLDLPRPIKRLPGFEPYRKLEHHIERVSEPRFGLVLTEADRKAIKAADELVLRTECRDLMAPLHSAWSRELHPDHGATMPETIEPMTPEGARFYFLKRWAELWRAPAAATSCQGFFPVHADDPVMVEAHHLSHKLACDAGPEVPYRELAEYLRRDAAAGAPIPISDADLDLLAGNADVFEDANAIAACESRYPATAARIDAEFR